MQQFAIIFLSILLEALPFVLIGTIVSSLIEIFVSREWLTEHLPKKSWFAFLVAGLAGIVFPICECAIVPVMRRLVKKGMPWVWRLPLCWQHQRSIRWCCYRLALHF